MAHELLGSSMPPSRSRLIEALRPNLIVELGTHGGFSYFSLCQAVRFLNLQCRCYAVDTWKGDDQAGYYGEEVLQNVENHNREHYSAFSTLIRSTFDEALSHFEEKSIDLVHIDGRHGYDDVKHDFLNWRPKLSERAVVLFHDTNVREPDFGVYRFWSEISSTFPHFEFLHGNGLGVLGVGKRAGEHLGTLFSASSNAEITTQIRSAYARLGLAVACEFRAAQQTKLREELAQWPANAAALREDIALRIAEETKLRDTIEKQREELAQWPINAAALREDIALRIAEETKLRDTIEKQREELAQWPINAAALREDIALRMAEETKLRDTIEKQREELAQWPINAAALREDIALRIAEETKLRDTIEKQREELAQWPINAAALREDIALRSEEETRLRDTIEKQREELAQWPINAAALREDIALQMEEETRLRKEIATQSNEASHIREALAQGNTEIAELRKEIEDLRSEFDQNLAKRVAELVERNETLSALDQKLAERARELSASQQVTATLNQQLS